MEQDGKDISEEADTMDFLEDAIAMEKHLKRSYSFTKNVIFLQLAENVRKKRSAILYQLVTGNGGEIYCSSKHALGCAKRLEEMADRKLDKKDIESAKKLMDFSVDFEVMFHIIRRLDSTNIKKENNGGNKNEFFTKTTNPFKA